MTSILVVDDEELLANTICRFLERRGHTARYATDASTAWKLFETYQFSLCLVDYRLGRQDGVELVGRMKVRQPAAQMIMMTGHGDMNVAIAAMRAGASDFLVKPVPLASLEAIVDGLPTGRAEPFTFEAADGIASLLGTSRAMRDLRASVSRVVEATRCLSDGFPPVLITGESGTGKDVVARAIHADGARASGPMVSINCASLPAELVESELFGHAKGAFTDARTEKQGLFESANGGVLFLDEIGDMPLGAQAKLLRVLEARVVRRVGSLHDVPVDVWVVAATNRSLPELVASGAFRGDLMFRLQVLSIAIPPLRQRDDDALLIADRLLSELGLKYGKPARRLSNEARAGIVGYHWPGNVRELRNVMERAVLLSPSEEIALEHLGLDAVPTVASEVLSDAPASLVEAEVRMLQLALERASGNVSRAASLLGISRDTLRYRMGKHGLTRAR